jgi:hypothetical protein
MEPEVDINVFKYEAWYGENGRLHRTDGPAYITSDGIQSWYVNSQDITKQVNDWMRKQNIVWPWDAETQAQFALIWGTNQ